MAEFSGSYEETFVLDVPIDSAKHHFGNLDTIIAHSEGMDRTEKLDDKTVHYLVKPRNAMGVEFRGDYTVEYGFATPTRFEWRSVGKGNMASVGSCDFVAKGDSRTQISYREQISMDLPINRLVAKAINPIVKSSISGGVKDYLERMRRSVRKS
jgi:carbon monoxide dehydrogenase subunit G